MVKYQHGPRLLPAGPRDPDTEQEDVYQKDLVLKMKEVLSLSSPVQPEPLIPKILDYWLDFKYSGLLFHSINVCLATISVLPSTCAVMLGLLPPDGKNVLKGLLYTYPPVRELPTAWDLSIILLRLSLPLELLLECSLHHLILKTVLLVAITLAGR